MSRIIDLCKHVPLLPVTIVSAAIIAILWNWRPWGSIPGPYNPSAGQWVAILLVAYTVVDTVRSMVEDFRHGHAGVDILAVIAILSTLAVQEYWASWAVVLMIWSGDAIEEYAQEKAKSNLTALVSAAPQTAHVVNLPGVGAGVGTGGGRTPEGGGNSTVSRETQGNEGFRSVTGPASAAQASGHGADAGDAHFHTVAVQDVKLGDVLVVLPGETTPVDGELLSGSATLDLSNINGEPVPREIFAGARVMSGAVNGSTTLTMRATQLAQDSQYQHILALVSSAQNSRAAVVKTADVLAIPFTILSLCIACAAWFVSGTPTRFAQVLVLATPCPLLIAAPVAYMAGTGRLAKAGILIKVQEVLENLGRVSHIFFDKTGTLTVKQPQVVRVDVPDGAGEVLRGAVCAPAVQPGVQGGAPAAVQPSPGRARTVSWDGHEKDRIVMLAGVVETYSVHILAKGIARAGNEAMRRLRARPSDPGKDSGEVGGPQGYPVVKNVKEDAGNGVSGEVDGLTVRVGRFAYVMQGVVPVSAPDSPARADVSDFFPTRDFTDLAADEMATYVAIEGRLAARLVLKDVPRSNSASSIKRLRALGVQRLTMVTGDKMASARIIADEVGIGDVQAELFPEDKVKAVADAAAKSAGKLPWWDAVLARFAGQPTQRPITMMVGDGVNDAPVLAAADIGMAITDGTSTAASESAQVVIMNDDIGAVPSAIAIARRTKRVMLQAVVAGLALALVGMVAAAFNLIPVVVGAFLQEAIDVISILWALTALFDRDEG